MEEIELKITVEYQYQARCQMCNLPENYQNLYVENRKIVCESCNKEGFEYFNSAEEAVIIKRLEKFKNYIYRCPMPHITLTVDSSDTN